MSARSRTGPTHPAGDSDAAVDANVPSPTFEEALRELEGIVEGMESGELGLEQSLDAYRRGSEIVRQCQVRLEAVRDQVRVLEVGQLRPFESELAGGVTGAMVGEAGDEDVTIDGGGR